MKPFKFRLQTKLDISCREEEQLREELQIRILLRDKLQKELDEIKSRLNEIESAIKEMMVQGFKMEQFLILNNYLPIIGNMLADKEAGLFQAEKAITETRNILIDKIKERKTLQKLRDKEWSNYLLELNKEEQKTIDELAINSHFRK